MKKIIIVVGQRCAGKTTLCNHLLNNYPKISVFEMSSLLNNMKAVEEDNSKNLSVFYNKKKKNERLFLVNHLIKEIEKSETPFVCISGLRKFHDYLIIKRNYNKIQIIFIRSSFIQRWERNLLRNRITNISFLNFFIDNIIKIKEGFICYASIFCDLKIYNSDSAEEMMYSFDCFASKNNMS